MLSCLMLRRYLVFYACKYICVMIRSSKYIFVRILHVRTYIRSYACITNTVCMYIQVYIFTVQVTVKQHVCMLHVCTLYRSIK